MCSLSDYLDIFCGNYFMQEGGAIIFVDVSKLGLGFFQLRYLGRDKRDTESSAPCKRMKASISDCL